jgi:putative toxin-antitoxin system antitoxin component (TIGR02293 family)
MFNCIMTTESIKQTALASLAEMLAGEPRPAQRKKGATSEEIQLLIRTLAGTNKEAYRIVRRGISTKSIVPFGAYLGLGKSEVADVLDLDRTTANRKMAKDEPLPMYAAETMLRLLDLSNMAEDTFATPGDAAAWLRKPHPMLDGETPLERAKSAFGTQQVRDMLVALKYGGVV